MKEDILNAIESKVSPLIKVWMNDGKSSLNINKERYIKDSIDSKEDVDVNLATLRNRSADLVCNSPLGSSAINTSRSNVIGAGLKVSPKIDYRLLGLTAEEAKEWQRHATDKKKHFFSCRTTET